mmetsp:Transcript_17130/g.46376  ORF Transcript_17130/g.46376 Transcript_17130/m.46376 type:complete len:221 (-) Transcript_17130:758-1420(-)
MRNFSPGRLGGTGGRSSRFSHDARGIRGAAPVTVSSTSASARLFRGTSTSFPRGLGATAVRSMSTMSSTRVFACSQRCVQRSGMALSGRPCTRNSSHDAGSARAKRRAASRRCSSEHAPAAGGSTTLFTFRTDDARRSRSIGSRASRLPCAINWSRRAAPNHACTVASSTCSPCMVVATWARMRLRSLSSVALASSTRKLTASLTRAFCSAKARSRTALC